MKKLTKHSSIYSVGNMLSRLVGIILIPLYTSYISKEMFGLYAIFEATFQFGQGLLLFGLPMAVFRWLSQEKDEIRQKTIFTSTLFFYTIISLILLSVVLLVKAPLSMLFFDSLAYEFYFLYTTIITVLLLFMQMITAMLRFENKSIKFVLAQLMKFILQLVFTIYFVVKMGIGIRGILLGHIFSNAIVLLILLPYVLGKINFRVDFLQMKRMVDFGTPLAISGLSSRFLNIGDRYLLGMLANMEAVGIYAIGYKIANMLDSFFIQAFQNSFIPMAWKKLDNKNAKRFYIKTLTYLSFFLFWVALFIASFQNEIIHIFSKNHEYYDVASIIGIVAFGICFKGMATVVKMGLQFSKQTKYIALIVFSAAVMNVILNIILIPRFSFVGAAFATLVSFVFMFLFALYLSNKYFPIQFEWGKVIKIIVSVLLIYLANIYVYFESLLFTILIKILLISTYPVLLYFWKYYDDIEILRLKQSWKKWRNPKNWKKNISDIKF